jgi:hypothetical protein
LTSAADAPDAEYVFWRLRRRYDERQKKVTRALVGPCARPR